MSTPNADAEASADDAQAEATVDSSGPSLEVDVRAPRNHFAAYAWAYAAPSSRRGTQVLPANTTGCSRVTTAIPLWVTTSLRTFDSGKPILVLISCVGTQCRRHRAYTISNSRMGEDIMHMQKEVHKPHQPIRI